ncbi:bifunctional chorismate mutase/prephenate dehydratase [Acutalibacter sp. 1XD8-33]|uniref:bifunctional chorismate mutase/prephenate dehydratase n=1 Tax=Acutalibacter sp. 1XD8-33 TaxID=2320081 RepID=UPI000EA1C85E|nr:bifunctional chorismate mutase/prephenate dehydratase [Acutalibacter sp. 1XD8-33]RKJ40376.1 bifunctional chorismate mutase/prephenate dehydratase [Acutalibacter sp. 1XD8-33]
MNEREFQEKLDVEREKIDQIDAQLLPLFLQRMECSQRVAELKGQVGAPVLNAQREQEILNRVSAQAGDFGGSAVALYQTIMAISRARQHILLDNNSTLRELERSARRRLPQPIGKVVCQGVEGAYSHQAARSLFNQIPVEFVPEFDQVFQQVAEGALGVLPVENSAAGSVTAVYDLILRYRFFIVGAVDVKVEHCLAAAGEGEITRVVSHPQALSQCSSYLTARGITPVEYSNTAAAAQYVAQECPAGVGAICSAEAAQRYGLRVVERGIQNEKNNTTRFVAVSREAVLSLDANKISLCFSLPHTTGSLYHILQRFALGGLNLTKIESRPIPGSEFEYDFYLDFTGCIHNPETLELICALNAELPRFSFLGNYSEFTTAEL